MKIILERENYEEVVLENCEFEITKIPAPTDLNFPIFRVDFTKKKSISESEIFEKISGTKTGYKIKNISEISDSNIAELSGAKSLKLKKTGDFTVKIVLEKMNFEDAEITGCRFRILSAAPSFTFDKINKTLNDSKVISKMEISEQVKGGDKTGWKIKSISELSGLAELSGTAPNLEMVLKKPSNIKFKIVMEHPNYFNAEINGEIAFLFQKHVGFGIKNFVVDKKGDIFASEGSRSDRVPFYAKISGKDATEIFRKNFKVVKTGFFPYALEAITDTKGRVWFVGQEFNLPFKYEGFLAEVDSKNGNLKNKKLFGINGSEIASIVELKGGGFLLGGSYEYLFKLDKDLNTIWSKKNSDNVSSKYSHVHERNDGNLLTIISPGNKVTLSLVSALTGGAIWEKSITRLEGKTYKEFNFTKAVFNADDTFYMGGHILREVIVPSTGVPNSFTEMVIVKVSKTGSIEKIKTLFHLTDPYDSGKKASVYQIIKSKDGNLIIFGQKLSKAVLFKIDKNLNILWEKRLLGGRDSKGDLYETPEGDLIVADGQYIIKLDSEGNILGSK